MKAAFGWLSRYFSKAELLLWGCSMGCILLSFAAFDRGSYLTLAASLIGATSLIFCAKGNPAGQVLMILFSLLYGLISFSFAYYGEMLTYLGMTAPMAVVSLVSWLRNPFQGNRSEVEVNRLPRREVPFMLVLTAAVTVVFYFSSASSTPQICSPALCPSPPAFWRSISPSAAAPTSPWPTPPTTWC